MSVSTTYPQSPVPPKKRGLGCLGCGCAALALLLIILVGLIGGVIYMGYKTTLSITSTTAPDIPSFNGGDDLFQKTEQKLADFDHDVKNHQAATIRLSADEINTLIAHNPGMTKKNVHAFVTFTDTEGRVQASFPTDVTSHGMMPGRYFSFDASFDVRFDSENKSVNLTPHAVQFGNLALIGPNSDNDPRAQTFTRSFVVPLLNQSFNQGIRKNPDGAALLDQAKTIEIQDSQLVIETQ
jgi:hypothetical protein